MSENSQLSANPDRILRLPQVKERTNLSAATIYRQIKEGKFPKALALGSRASGWRESEIVAWQAALLQK